jgi:hypothetical protein
MKRTLILVALLFGLTAGASVAQTRVGVSLSFGTPYVAGQVVIGLLSSIRSPVPLPLVLSRAADHC